MASEIKKEDLIEKHCELIDVFNGYKEFIDIKYAMMIEQELKLAGTMLTHITAEYDEIQLVHMQEYLAVTESFLANLWKGKKDGIEDEWLVTTWCSLNQILEEKKDEMELKYSSAIAAELKIADIMIRNHKREEKMAEEHISAYLRVIDSHLGRVLNIAPQVKPKK